MYTGPTPMPVRGGPHITSLIDDLTMLMHKILQKHLLCAFVANLKIGAIYALYPESFCDKNLAIRKVFAFCDSAWSKGTRQKRFSGFCPLRGGGYPPFPLR